MFKFTSAAAAIALCGLLTTASYGQFDFDGDVDNTWETAANWFDGVGDPATPPTFTDVSNINGFSVSSTGPGNQSADVNIGTSAAASLFVSAGLLQSSDDLTVGAMGSLTVTAGTAQFADDMFINGGGSVEITGGSLEITDNVVLDGATTILVDGGTWSIRDDIRGNNDTEVVDMTIIVDSGEILVRDKIIFDQDSTNSSITINSGVVRANEYGVNADADPLTRGPVEINGDGLFQIEDNITSADLVSLIDDGTLFTTDAGKVLGLQIVNVPDFFGGPATFFQVSVVPEPTSVALLGLGALGFVARRRR